MAIAQVGGANNNSAVNVATISATYAPTNGNILIVGLAFSASITSPTVKDNNNVALTAGPVLNNARLFYYTVTGSPTSFTASWTGNVQVSIMVEEYSGASGTDVRSTMTAQGNSTTPTLTFAILQPNNWIVAILTDGVNTITGATGNQRQQTTASGARGVLMDNTSGSAGNVTCSGTATSGAWNAVGIELGGPGQVVVTQEAQLALVQRTSQFAEIHQDVLLAVVPWANLPLNRVAHEVLLVVTPYIRSSTNRPQLWVIT